MKAERLCTSWVGSDDEMPERSYMLEQKALSDGIDLDFATLEHDVFVTELGERAHFLSYEVIE